MKIKRKRINKRQALIKESQREGDLAQEGNEKGFMTLEFIFLNLRFFDFA